MKVNAILQLPSSSQRLREISRFGSVATQVGRLNEQIDRNTFYNVNSAAIENPESYPNQINESPARRAMKLLDTV